MSPFLILCTEDFPIGRVDKASLSQQTVMEMVIKKISNKQRICGDSFAPKEIKEWTGVGIESEEVKEIDWSKCGLRYSYCNVFKDIVKFSSIDSR